MNEGDIVMIYHDPISRTTPEGHAKLLAKKGFCGVHEGHPLELWSVMFLADSFQGTKLIINTEKRL